LVVGHRDVHEQVSDLLLTLFGWLSYHLVSLEVLTGRVRACFVGGRLSLKEGDAPDEVLEVLLVLAAACRLERLVGRLVATTLGQGRGLLLLLLLLF